MVSILILGPSSRNKPLIDYFEENNINVLCMNTMPSENEIVDTTHLISNGFAYKIPESILMHYEKLKRVNVHSTYLPFGCGIGGALTGIVFPVILGATIHILEKEFDSGGILFQKELMIENSEISQRDLYHILLEHANHLFLSNIEDWLEERVTISQHASTFNAPYSNRTNSEVILSILSNGWDTPIYEINDLAIAVAMRKAWSKYLDS